MRLARQPYVAVLRSPSNGLGSLHLMRRGTALNGIARCGHTLPLSRAYVRLFVGIFPSRHPAAAYRRCCHVK